MEGNLDLIVALQQNPKIEMRGERVLYRTKYDVRERWDLVRLIGSLGQGPLLYTDLIDLYPTAAADIDDMTRKGDIIRVKSVDTMLPDVVYARDTTALASITAAASGTAGAASGAVPESDRLSIRLSGVVNATHGSNILVTSVDLTAEVMRNDVIVIAGAAYRVSSEPADYVPPGATKAATSAATYSGGAGAVAADGLAASSSAAASSAGAAIDGGAAAASAATAASTGPGCVAASIDRSLHPATGVYYGSIGNNVKLTGGSYSVADTAPHMLRPGKSYAQRFTAKQLPLDRPWEGPTATGLIAYKLGCTADLRVLWREVVTHSTLTQQVAPSAAAPLALPPGSAAAATPGMARPTEVDNGGETLLLSLGGAQAFKKMRPFPVSHRELREEMRVVGLVTRMLPGTLEAIQPTGGAAKQRAQKIRRPDRRALSLTTGSHLTGSTLQAVHKAQVELVRRQIETQRRELEGKAAPQR